MLRLRNKVKQIFPKTQIIKSVAAPIGGLNSRDSIAAMAPTDAINLVNWLPDTYGVRCRKGYKEWAINFPSDKAVESIMSYFSAQDTIPGGGFLTDPTSMPGSLFAATEDGIYDITTTTDTPTLAIALSGGDNAGWFSSTILSNSAGTWLLACSETDGYHTFDGTTWLKRVAGAGPTQILGVDPGDLVQVALFKKRAWFVERDSTNAWYLDADAVSGTASKFDFGPLLKHGGHLAYLANWTIDAGEGIDDFLVAVGSNGDVLVYKGTDPDDAATFANVGTWYVGQIPVGRRGFSQYGGDLILISADGVFPISYVTRGGADFLQASSKDYSTKIRPTIGADLRASFTTRGWQLLLHPSERMLVVNVPDHAAILKRQYSLSTTQNEWALFSDIPIYSMGSSVGYSFAGTRDGRVLLLFTGFFDNVAYGESTGQSIRGIIQPAFSDFGAPAMEKIFVMIRPNFLAVDVPGVLTGINVNYSIRPPTGSPSYTANGSSLWDTSLWDDAIWGGEMSTYSSWITVGGVGFAGAATLIIEATGDSILTSIDYMLSAGGPI